MNLDNRRMGPGSGHNLIGRAAELTTLLTLAAQAADGRGRLVVVRGEAGIGKTRLLSEFASRAPLVVVWGRCSEAGGAPAMWPWSQVLRRLARMPGESDDAAMALRDIGSADDPTSSQFRRLEMFEAVVDRLASVAANTPLAVILDDLHVADQASLELLTFLTEELDRLPLLVVAVGRDESAGGGDRVTAALRPVRGQSVTLALVGLSRPEIGDLAAGSDRRISDDLLDSLLELTAGNPLFIEELLHWLAGRPAVVAVRETSLPVALQDAVVQRLAQLGPRTVDVLEVASVLGRRADSNLVAELGGWPGTTVRDAVREAVQHAVVVVEGSASQHVAFRHGLLREAIHYAIEPGRREQLHLRAARLLSSDPDVQVGTIAMHLQAAGDLPSREEVRVACERAAEVAGATFAYAEAAELYRAAQHRADSRGERARLGAALGVALHHAGQIDDARRAFLAAADLAHAEGDPELLARCALGYGGEWITLPGGPDERHVALLEKARRLVGDSDPILATRLDARLLVSRFEGAPTAAISAAAAAVVQRARELGDPATKGYALLAQRTVSSVQDVELRIAVQDELRATTEATEDLDTLMRVVHWQLTTALEMGDMSRALACAGEAGALAERAKRALYRSWAHRSRAMWALLTGRFDEAETEATAALQVNAEGSDPFITQTYGAQLLQVRYEQGRSAEFLPLLDRLVEQYPLAPVWRCARARQLLTIGARDRAIGDYEALVAGGIGAFVNDYTRLISVILAAEVCVELGDETFAQVLYDELTPHAGRAAVAGFAAVVCFGAVDLFLGMLADVLGKDEAEQHFQVAADLNARLGARTWIARARLHHARYLLRRHPTRHDEAMLLLRSAAKEAEVLGAVALARDVAHTLEAASSSVRLTVIFTDIEDSTVLVGRIGDAAWRPVQAAHAHLVRACLADHDGEERQHLGDGFFLAFRSPANAVAFACDLQRRNARQDVDVPIRIRVGMHTSEVGRGPDGLFGLGVHVASRICSLARGEEILLSAVTAEEAGVQAESLGQKRVETLRGVTQPTTVAAVRWQLSAVPPTGRDIGAASG